MSTLLTCNLSTKTVTDGDSAWTPPPYRYNEDLTLALRFQQRAAGQVVEPALDIRSFRAAIGNLDARPESGTWALQIGSGAQTSDNTTAALSYDCSAAELAVAINAKAAVVTAYGVATVRKEDGSWIITFATATAEVPLQVVGNALWPPCLGQISAYQVDEKWQHEVRLTQAPVAFTDSQQRVLPSPPVVTPVQDGGTNGGYSWNEVQSLYVPPDFRGTYLLRFGDYARTEELSVSDTAETIQTALVKAIGGPNVVVTNNVAYTARIEFVNELAASDQPLLQVQALHPPPGDVTFTLKLNRAALWRLLRRLPAVQLPLEVRIWTADADDVISEQVAFVQDVVIARPVTWPDQAEVPDIDWLRPLSPKSYVPFSEDTVITGQQFFPKLVGDGEATSFSVDHGLDTEIVYTFVRENGAGGRQLQDGVDFRATYPLGGNSVTVEALTGAPAVNGWLVVVMSAQTVAAFANGLTVTIGQVTGLQAILDAIGDQVAEILEMIPTTPLGVSSSGGSAFVKIDLPLVEEVFPGGSNGAAPKPAGGLLPAIHNATVGSITAGLPSASGSVGSVATNDSGAPLILPGAMRIRSSSIAVGAYAASDGRRWYPVTRRGTTNSYFPRDFERELFFFDVTDTMLRAGTSVLLDFTLKLQLLDALTRAQYLVVLEHGSVPTQATPSPTATNLQDIVWSDTPLFSQRVILGPVPVEHSFGAQVIRAANGVLSANKTLYKFTTPADAVPASANFALRGRLVDFDTENSQPAPRGAVSYKLTSGSAVIS